MIDVELWYDGVRWNGFSTTSSRKFGVSKPMADVRNMRCIASSREDTPKMQDVAREMASAIYREIDYLRDALERLGKYADIDIDEVYL